MPMPVVEPIGELSQKTTEPEEVYQDETLRIAHDTVQELLQKMRVRAKVTARYIEVEEPECRGGVWVDVRGDDLSFLIGP